MSDENTQGRKREIWGGLVGFVHINLENKYNSVAKLNK